MGQQQTGSSKWAQKARQGLNASTSSTTGGGAKATRDSRASSNEHEAGGPAEHNGSEHNNCQAQQEKHRIKRYEKHTQLTNNSAVAMQMNLSPCLLMHLRALEYPCQPLCVVLRAVGWACMCTFAGVCLSPHYCACVSLSPHT